MNNNMIHDQLFAMQESVKQSKGIKPKTKQIQAAALGDEIGKQSSRHNTMSVKGTRYNVGDIFDYNGITYKVTNTNEATPIKAREGYGGPASTGWPTQFNPVSVQSNTQRPMSIVPPGSYGVTSTSTTTPVSVSSTSVKRRRTTPSTSTGLIDEGKPELPLLGMTLQQQILYMMQTMILQSLLVLHLMILVIEKLEQIDVINYLIKQETHCQGQLL